MNLSKSSIKDVLSNIRHSDVFLSRVGIDITNDDRMLSEALAEKNKNLNSILATLYLLNELGEEDIHWLLEPTANLINHIKDRYHNRHRLQLPMLISLAHQVEFEHREDFYCPIGLTDHLNNLHRDLLAHMETEELILFPFLSEEKMSYVFAQLSLAMHNHDHEIHMLSKIYELTNQLTLPENATKVWKTLYVELEVFKKDMLEHIRLENDILLTNVVNHPGTFQKPQKDTHSVLF